MGQSSGNQPLNRRHSYRYPCTGAAEISKGGSRWGWGNVNEISQGGCYIEIVQLLPIDTETQLQLTIADTILDIGAKVASNDQMIGMGMEFVKVSPEQESKLTEILKKVADIKLSGAMPKAEHSQTKAAPMRITRDAAPDILAMIIKRVNEKGVLTRQELVDIVKTRL